jgi:hypothetical protein
VAVFLEDELRLHLIVRIARRNREIGLAGARRDDTLFDRVFREDQADAGAVGPRFAGRDVMNLKDQHGALLDQFGLSGPQNQRRFAGRPTDQSPVGIGGTLARAPSRGPDH